MSDRPIDRYACLLPLEVCTELQSAPQGLTQAEAATRVERCGLNQISNDERQSLTMRLLAPFTNWIALLLLIAGTLAFLSGTPLIGWAIMVVAMLNGLFTLWQEYLAERAISALRHLLPETTFVRRDGQVGQVPTSKVVPGDILPLKPGTMVVADGYLIAGEGVRVRQTMLTGNSAPVTKVAGPMSDMTLATSERPNLLLAGTQVIEGQGSLVVAATGMQTVLGEIAERTAALRTEQSLLGQALKRLAATVSRVAIAAGVVAFLLTTFVQHLDLHASLIFAIGMIVAFVPEGLLPTVTLALALARRRLQRQRVLVKRLAGIESLGSATVLCLDRAGSLASNVMTVAAVWVGGCDYQVTGTDYTPEGAFLHDRALINPADEPALLALLRAAGLCNNARLLPPDDEIPQWHVLGDPVEGALLVAAAKAGLSAQALAATAPRLHSFPYESRRQVMSVIVAGNSERSRVPHAYVRAAGVTLLPRCTHIIRDGTIAAFDEHERALVQQQMDTYAREGLRVLTFAKCQLEEGLEPNGWRAQDIEHDLTLIGLVALQEPPRPEVTQMIDGCRAAGMRILLTTGAYGLTAEANARRAHITTAERVQIVTGADIDAFDEQTLQQTLSRDDTLFAQLAAEHKQRTIAALQARGEVVVYLGDSISDAPALKQADIGVAVSTSGTTVALAAADIVLDADHPAGLLLAIEEGRAIFSNIQKFSTYIFTHNLAETVAVIVGVLIGLPLPLTVLQVLAIDLGTELFPAIALSTEPPEPGILNRPPRPRSAPLLDQTVLMRSFAWLGVLEGMMALGAYFLGYWNSGWRFGQVLDGPGSPIYAHATTLAYAAIVMAQLGNALASRTRRVSLRQIGFFTNRVLLIGLFLSVALMVLLIYVPPLAILFGFEPPTMMEWFVLATFPVIILVAEEGRKHWARHRRQMRSAAQTQAPRQA